MGRRSLELTLQCRGGQKTYTLDMMGDVDEKDREKVCLVMEVVVLSCLKEKDLLAKVEREEEKRGATKAGADRAQVEVTRMRGISGAAMATKRLVVGCVQGSVIETETAKLCTGTEQMSGQQLARLGNHRNNARKEQ